MFKKQSNQRVDVLPETLIGPRTMIDGNVRFNGGLCVEGRVKGEIRALDGESATLILSENGHVEGKIFAPIVRVSGSLVGDIHASEQVELTSTAKVEGNIHYRVVEMIAGAQLNGRLIYSEERMALPSPDRSETD